MGFRDDLQKVIDRIPVQLDLLATEEATKLSLVMPFIGALGYDVSDPTQVVPEYTADVGTRRGEKVDFAIIVDGKPGILIECKTANTNLSQAHVAQLFRYFTAEQSAQIGILTNGTEYWFYSDLEGANRMDDEPFFVVDLLNADEDQLEYLAQYQPAEFEVESVRQRARERKYYDGIVATLQRQHEAPDREFVDFLARNVYEGRLTPAKRSELTPIVRDALRGFVRQRINDVIQRGFQSSEEPGAAATADADPAAATESAEVAEAPAQSEIETTTHELEGYFAVKALLRDVVDLDRVSMRDTRSYCGVLLDNNNRKPLCRLRFNNSRRKYIGTFDAKKVETRHAIEKIDDIFGHADEIRAAVAFYD